MKEKLNKQLRRLRELKPIQSAKKWIAKRKQTARTSKAPAAAAV